MYKCPYCKAELDDFERYMTYDDEVWTFPDCLIFHIVTCPNCTKEFDYVEKYRYIASEIIPRME